MTYDEFLNRNTEIRHYIRNWEKANRVKEPKKFMKIEQISLEKNICSLSDGSIIKIDKLVNIVMNGKDCVSNPSILSYWKGFNQNFNNKRSKEEEKFLSFGGKITELQTYCGKPCYLSSKSITEHLLWIPSNVTQLNHTDATNKNALIFTSQIQKLHGYLKVMGGINLVSCESMFEKCKHLSNIYFDNFSTKKVKYMTSMFQDCKGLKELNLSTLVTELVENMYGMFENCTNLVLLNLNSFDTGNVVHMGSMFEGCESLRMLNLRHFDTRQVYTMQNMFLSCKSLIELDLRSFKTPMLEYLYSMFQGCTNLRKLNISQFDICTSNDFGDIFIGCDNLRPENIIVSDAKILQLLYEKFDF